MKPLRTDCLDKLTNKQRREFARWCASRVIEKWAATDTVQRYLETGDKELRNQALNTSRYAANAASVIGMHTVADAALSSVWAAADEVMFAADDSAYTAASAADNPAAERDAQNDKLVEMAG